MDGACDMGAEKEPRRWQGPKSISMNHGELWFEDREGTLRNVCIGGPAAVKILPVPVETR